MNSYIILRPQGPDGVLAETTVFERIGSGEKSCIRDARIHNLESQKMNAKESKRKNIVNQDFRGHMLSWNLLRVHRSCDLAHIIWDL